MAVTRKTRTVQRTMRIDFRAVQLPEEYDCRKQSQTRAAREGNCRHLQRLFCGFVLNQPCRIPLSATMLPTRPGKAGR
jgi:hypothetical protein